MHKHVAALVLADYASDRPAVVLDLLPDLDRQSYALVRPIVERYRVEVIARVSQEFDRRPDWWKDKPLDPAWKQPDEPLRREVEQAGGLLAERFAFCQALSLARLQAVTEGIRPAGYRPIRVRPWGEPGPATRVAVVWTRDGGGWTLRTGLTAQEVKRGVPGGLAADIAGYCTAEGDRYVMLGCSAEKGERTVVTVGLGEEVVRRQVDQAFEQGYVPVTLHPLIGSDGAVRYSGVWWKGSGKAPKNDLVYEDDPTTHADRILAGALLPVDVTARESGGAAAWAARMVADSGFSRIRELLVGTRSLRRYTSVWHLDTTRNSIGLYELPAEAHLARCKELAREGYRPVALSLVPRVEGAQAASVWHRPALPVEEADRLAKWQGVAGAMLMALGQPESIWPLWRHSPDPTVRSHLVEQAGLRGVDPQLLIRRLEEEKETSVRRALILALGEYTEKDLPASVRQPLVQKLLRWYRDDPDPGIHGAIDWLLRHNREGPVARPLDWGQRQELERIDRELVGKPPRLVVPALAGGGANPARDGTTNKGGWFVNGQGQTFTVIPGPITFRMGSSLAEADRFDFSGETPHVRVIPRSYAVQTKAVTGAEYEQFLTEHPQFRSPSQPGLPGQDPAGPMVDVRWIEAAAYCNWLSKKEGIPREQWVYPEKIVPGTRLFPNYLSRTGYRLATETEWEYACKAGAETPRYYGSSETLLGRYAHYLGNSESQAWPVGQKRPNDIGLFDMHGNVWTWCDSAKLPYSPGRFEDTEYESDIVEGLDPSSSRIIRGVSFNYRAPFLRFSFRGFNLVHTRNERIGLRLCRTCRRQGPT